jgi:hypothetical protein
LEVSRNLSWNFDMKCRLVLVNVQCFGNGFSSQNKFVRLIILTLG